MNVFAFTDYRLFVAMKTRESRGNLKKYSEVLHCQGSYLIRVIDGTSNLTPDQAYLLAENLGFSIEERDYFMTLVNYERAGELRFKTFLKKQLDQMREAHNKIGTIMKRTEPTEAQKLLDYHCDPRISLLHFLTACKDYQTLDSVAKRLNLNLEEAKKILVFLQERNFILVNGKQLVFNGGTSHIPLDSPILPIFLMNWRNYAVQKSYFKEKESVHYSNIQTISRKDLTALIEISSQFIKNTKNICDQSGSEELVVINLDVFKP